MIRKIAMLLVFSFVSLPANVFADGVSFTEEIEGANLEVKATTQRAVLWQRHDVWEMHIMPVFERYKAKAAWVVPFPVKPTIEESSTDFFNQLELLTSPMFIDACVRVTRSGCDSAPSDYNSAANAEGASAHVEIWEQGTVGDLDYVVISAEEQSYIVEWLRENKYYVTALAEASLKKVEAEGTYFFAARLSEEADPSKPLMPVRFVLPDLETPMYPLVLTGLGVPRGASLELSLWVVTPEEDKVIPDSHSYDYLEESPANIDEYNDALRDFYRSHDRGTLVLLYSNRLQYDSRINKQVCLNRLCVDFAELGIDVPETWCPEITEISEGGYSLSRYQGRLGPLSLSRDLTFKPRGEEFVATVLNTYENDVCDADEANAGLFLVILFTGAVIIAGRRFF